MAPAGWAALAVFFAGLAHALSCDVGKTEETTSSGGATGSGTPSGNVSSSGGGGGTGSSNASGTSGAGGGAGSSSASSTSGVASSSGAVSSSSASSSSGAAVPTCMDGVKNGNETGVDCGGTCPPCVPYMIGPPNTNDTVQNACTSGGNVSYICPRFMLFSLEMKQAAADDAAANGWPVGSFNYGVATLDGAACCSCYQVVYDDPQNPADTYSPPKPLIIQNFNTGGAPMAFDVFMGKGGEGAETQGCAKLYTNYPTTGEPGGGGITVSPPAGMPACGTTSSTVASAACVSAITGECDEIQGQNAYVTTTTQNSCIESNSAQSLYHINWKVKARQVECPTALTEVTGCKPNAGNNPHPDPTVQTAAEASSWGSFSTTTMEDCCKPSCAWPGNVQNTQAPWSAMYQCDVDGNPMHN
jgi:hypothetical protein